MRIGACTICGSTSPLAGSSMPCPTCHPSRLSIGTGNRQRRQVTILFADIVDYTGLALALDPEDLRRLLQSYYDTARAAIEAQGGVVAELLADGVVAHFGFPVAFSDAPDRALNAAADLVRGAITLPAGDGVLSVRVGVATGLVLAEYDGRVSRVTGASAVSAARLQSIAEVNTICVAQSTRRLSQRREGFRYLGEHVLKGFHEAERVWRFDPDAAHSENDPAFPFVGRERELHQLTSLWEEVVSTGRASTLQIVAGPPGFGKSRLLREFCDRIDLLQPAILFQAAELHRNTSLYPFAEWLRRVGASGLAETDNRYLLGLVHAEAAMELMCSEAPPAIRDGTFNALTDHLRAIASQGPVPFIIEDLQWLDQSSLELVVRLIEDLHDSPILWLAACRPEGAGRLAIDGTMIMTLPELSGSDCRLAATDFCGEEIAPQAKDLLARCEGVPILLEHLLRAFMDGWLPTSDALPEMLSGVLTAWIDRVDAVPSTVQHAAVIGRNATPAILAQMANRTQGEVERDIDSLCVAQILRRESDFTVGFRHDLLREAAYRTLPRDERKALHRWFADALERTSPDPSTGIIGEIAFHCEAADDFMMAAEYRHRLGKFATATGAFAEAEIELRHAMELLARVVTNHDEVMRHRAHILTSLAANHMQTRGFTDPSVVRTYTESLAHLEGLENADLDSLAIYWGIFTYQVLLGRMTQAQETVDRMIDVLSRASETTCSDEHVLSVLGTRNAIEFYTGQFSRQLRTIAQIRERYRFDRHAVLATKYGMDLFATAQAFAPHSAAITGRFALARQLIFEADAHQMQLGVPLMLPFVDIWGGVALSYIDDFAAARQRIERGIERADRQGAAFWSATGRMWLAVIDFDEYGGSENRARIEQALALQKLIGVGVGVPYWTAKLAEAYARDGHDDKARQLAEEALSTPASERVWLAERQRICGFVHECGGRRQEALDQYRIAAQTARSQNAVLWELKAKSAMGALLSDRAEIDRLKVVLSNMKETSPARAVLQPKEAAAVRR